VSLGLRTCDQRQCSTLHFVVASGVLGQLLHARADHLEELAAERQRTDAILEALRVEHRRETEALQVALTTPRPTQHEQPTPQPQQTTQRPERRR
jgi:hypothetical protein